jgi:hypothetical protein
MIALTVNGDDTFDFYREDFPWGRTPAYRTADGRYRFIASDGSVLTPSAMANELMTWDANSLATMALKDSRYAELRALPE